MAKFSISNLKEILGDPSKRIRFILIVGAFSLVVPLFFTLSLTLASNPKFCGSVCHNMTPEYQSWTESSHSHIPCYGCHMGIVNPISFIYLKAKDGLISGKSMAITGVDYPINKDSEIGLYEIEKETCERCHNMATRKITPSSAFGKNMAGRDEGKKKKFHSKHLAKGINCTVCHNRVAHDEYAKKESREGNKRKQEIFGFFQEYKGENKSHKYENFLEMSGCIRCHTVAKNRDKELLDHYPKVKETKEIPMECVTCHDAGKAFSTHDGERFCVLCHSKEQAAKFQ